MEVDGKPFKPLFALKLTPKGIAQAHLIASMFTRHGQQAVLDLVLEEEAKRNYKKPRLLFLNVDPGRAEAQAEILEWEVMHQQKQYLEPFSCSRRSEFVATSPNASYELFSEADYLFLSECVLREVRVGPEDDDWMQQPQMEAEPPRLGEVLINACIRMDLCEEEGLCVLRHSPDRQMEMKLIRQSLFQHPILPKDDSLRNYFGEEVTYYFEWMRHFTTMLTIPAGVYVLLMLFTYLLVPDVAHRGTVDRNPYVPLYSLVVVIWGFVFCKTWSRRSQSLAYRWRTLQMNERVFLNPNFHGKWRASPITGEAELYYPTWKRRCYFLLSGVVTAVMLAVAFAFMIASLNIQGLIHEKTRFDNDNPFYISFLSQYSGNGGIFDPNGDGWLSFFPTILHSIIIFTLNQFIYRRIAEHLTKWENHRLRLDHERSLILKRYFFDAFDSYIALFYLAFYEVDVIKLRQALLGLYVTDNLRRIVLESVIPFLISRSRYGAEAFMKKRSAHQSVKVYPEAFCEAYEEFDDYLEMVVEHGYITLFASACPLASLLSVFTNIIELKADVLKLLCVTQRPLPRKSRDIGIWEDILKAQTWLAVLTNVLIFGFSSEQMMQWCPWFFKRVMVWDATTHGLRLEQELKQGSGRYVLSLVFLIEHILIFVGLLIHWSIHERPLGLRLQQAKNDYRRKLALEGKMDPSLLPEDGRDYCLDDGADDDDDHHSSRGDKGNKKEQKNNKKHN